MKNEPQAHDTAQIFAAIKLLASVSRPKLSKMLEAATDMELCTTNGAIDEARFTLEKVAFEIDRELDARACEITDASGDVFRVEVGSGAWSQVSAYVPALEWQLEDALNGGR
jgi:hypothetical protein